MCSAESSWEVSSVGSSWSLTSGDDIEPLMTSVSSWSCVMSLWMSVLGSFSGVDEELALIKLELSKILRLGGSNSSEKKVGNNFYLLTLAVWGFCVCVQNKLDTILYQANTKILNEEANKSVIKNS